MAYNKVTYGGNVIIDLTGDTVTEADLKFGVLAHDKSGKIITGTSVLDSDTSKDTATAEDVLAGKTAHSKGQAVTGEMENNGAVTGYISSVDDSFQIAKGYHDGNGSVSINADEKDKIIPGNIRNGVSILGVTGTVQAGSTTIGTDTSDATAVASNILSGKTAYAAGKKLTGTMVNNGAVSGSITTKAGSYTIPEGYHNGSGTVSIPSTEQAKIVAGNIKSGVTILGVRGSLVQDAGLDTSDATATAGQILYGQTAYVDGEKVTGTMANNGAVTGSVGVGGSYTIPAGYHSGTGSVTGPTLSGTATADHVLADDTFYSNSGTEQTGTMVNNGSVEASLGVGDSYTIPEGYHDGTGTVSNSVTNVGAVSGSVGVGGTYSSTPAGYVSSIRVTGPTLSGTASMSDVLYGETFYSSTGTKQTGSMPNNGSVDASVGIGGSYTIPEGYHDGTGTVTNSVPTVGVVSGTVAVGGTYSTTPNGYVTSVRVTGPTLSGNATADQVLSGRTFYSNTGTRRTGTLEIQHYYTGTSAPSSSTGEDGDIYLVSEG